MAEIDVNERLRAQATAARREVEIEVDVDAAWARAMDRIAGDRPEPSAGWADVHGDRRARRVGALSAAAAVVVLVAGLAVVGVVRRGDDGGGPPATTPGTDVEVTVPVTDPPTTVPGSTVPDATPAPTTVAPSTVPTTGPSAPAGVIAASSADPPLPLALEAFVEVELTAAEMPGQQDGEPVATPNWAHVEVGELGIVVNQTDAGFVTVVGFDGSQRHVPVDEGESGPHIAGMAYGPGDVLYAVRPVDDPPDFVMEAIALSGPRAGETVARTDGLGTGFTHLGTSPFGHGSEAVVDRRGFDLEPLMRYVDVEGTPITLPGSTPPVVQVSDDLRVTTSDGATWQLSVDGSTAPASTFDGPPRPAPASGGRVVYGTWFRGGSAEEPPDGPIVAILEADGSGSWWSVPDGWSFAASDVWGTVFARQIGSTLQLALLEDVPRRADVDPTPVVDDAAWRSTFEWERSTVQRTCATSWACTQLRTAADGTAVSYDPASRSLTWHARPFVTATVPDTYGDVWLDVVGPEGVAYLHVDAEVPDEDGLAADLVAITAAQGSEVVEIGRWPDVVDRIGDSELAAVPDGLVIVGCCGPGTVRPTPGAPVVVPWVDATGAPIDGARPDVRAELGVGSVTITRDEMAWTFDPGAGWLGRGMPLVVPTFDGGVLVSFADTSGHAVVARGWPDGATASVGVDGEVESIEPSGIVLVPNGERFARIVPFDDGDDVWPGRREVDVDAGAISFPGLDAYVADERPSWAFDPVTFANALAGPVRAEESRSIGATQLDGGVWRVVVSLTGFFDDSVDGVRIEVELVPAGDGTYRVAEGRWSNVCQPGRGHQEFQASLCT